MSPTNLAQQGKDLWVQGFSSAPSGAVPCTPTRVIDGDTIDALISLHPVVFGVQCTARCRLVGIDTPETRTRDLEEKRRGLAAKSRLKDLIASADECRALFKKKGKYGRYLVTLFVSGPEGWVNVNRTLVKEGHAVQRSY